MTLGSDESSTLCANAGSTSTSINSSEKWVELSASSSPSLSPPSYASTTPISDAPSLSQGTPAYSPSLSSSSSASSTSPWLCYRTGNYIRHKIVVLEGSTARCEEAVARKSVSNINIDDSPLHLASSLFQQNEKSHRQQQECHPAQLLAEKYPMDLSPLSPMMPFSCHLKNLNTGYSGVFPENRVVKKPKHKRAGQPPLQNCPSDKQQQPHGKQGKQNKHINDPICTGVTSTARDLESARQHQADLDAKWYYRNVINTDSGLALSDFDSIAINESIALDVSARETLAVKNRIILCSLTLTIPIFLYLRFTFWN